MAKSASQQPSSSTAASMAALSSAASAATPATADVKDFKTPAATATTTAAASPQDKFRNDLIAKLGLTSAEVPQTFSDGLKKHLGNDFFDAALNGRVQTILLVRKDNSFLNVLKAHQKNVVLKTGQKLTSCFLQKAVDGDVAAVKAFRESRTLGQFFTTPLEVVAAVEAAAAAAAAAGISMNHWGLDGQDDSDPFPHIREPDKWMEAMEELRAEERGRRGVVAWVRDDAEMLGSSSAVAVAMGYSNEDDEPEVYYPVASRFK